jgi:hypothetical protein
MSANALQLFAAVTIQAYQPRADAKFSCDLMGILLTTCDVFRAMPTETTQGETE